MRCDLHLPQRWKVILNVLLFWAVLCGIGSWFVNVKFFSHLFLGFKSWKGSWWPRLQPLREINRIYKYIQGKFYDLKQFLISLHNFHSFIFLSKLLDKTPIYSLNFAIISFSQGHCDNFILVSRVLSSNTMNHLRQENLRRDGDFIHLKGKKQCVSKLMNEINSKTTLCTVFFSPVYCKKIAWTATYQAQGNEILWPQSLVHTCNTNADARDGHIWCKCKHNIAKNTMYSCTHGVVYQDEEKSHFTHKTNANDLKDPCKDLC